MGVVTKKENEDLGRELNEMINSLGYEVVIYPEDDSQENPEEIKEDKVSDEKISSFSFS